jgi:aspartate/methionine/tyrosine aminotransferase
MIGWRVGWVVGPSSVVADTARVSISNVVCQTGIAMGAVATAIRDAHDGIQMCVEEWQRRRDVLLDQLRDLSVVPPHGGWSLLLDVQRHGWDSVTAATRLLEIGKIATTPMVDWGSENSRKYVRFVFSNEPVHRLKDVRARVERALLASASSSESVPNDSEDTVDS